MLCLASGQIPPEPYSGVLLKVMFIAEDKRQRDLDNLFASMKSYIDGIVQAKVIRDDNTKYIADYIIRYRSGKKANTIIEIGGYDD